MACRLEKQTHENLLRERFFTWMHDPQITINQKKQDLKDCFDAFCKAIDHKKLYKKMIFEQEVLKPNQEHALLVEASREQREAMPPVPEAVSIIKKDKLEQVVEQISHANTDSSQETTRLARIARRAHRAMQRNVLLGDARRKFNKYESDVMGTVEERNAKIALEQFNEQQKQKRIALQQEQAKPIISAFLYAADDAKKVAILRQKQQVRQETRRAALSGPDAWSHDPYKNHGIDLSFSNYSASIDGNDGLSDSFSSPVAVAAVTEKKDGTMDGNQSAHLHRTLGSDHYLAREFDDMNRDLKEIAAQSGRFFDFALQEVRSNFKK